MSPRWRTCGTWRGLRYWYQAAEIKAQVVLAISGALVAVLGGSLLGNRDDVAATVAVFGPETWVFLAGMTAAFALSILCAVFCLVARGLRSRRVREEFTHLGVDPTDAATYVPEVTGFFLHLAALEPAAFTERMRTVDPPFVLQALSSNRIRFARNILRKHRWATGRSSAPGSGSGSCVPRRQLPGPGGHCLGHASHGCEGQNGPQVASPARSSRVVSPSLASRNPITSPSTRTTSPHRPQASRTDERASTRSGVGPTAPASEGPTVLSSMVAPIRSPWGEHPP
jgi:hypothetical protein